MGWIVMEVGAAGLVTGGVTGALGITKRDSLDDSGACVDKRCMEKKDRSVGSYNAMRIVSTVGFVVGAVGIGAGLTLILTAPSGQSKEVAGVRPWIGLGSAGLGGSF
jgi:hypothetical protein